MSRRYFGTDGIRGTVGKPPITPDFMLRLGHAVGRVLRRTQERPTVLIGKDTRLSGYMIESALEAGFASAGVDVLLDDRGERPGAMFANWELIGVPHRVTIGDKGLKDGQVEYQHRRDAAATKVALAEVAAFVKGRLAA